MIGSTPSVTRTGLSIKRSDVLEGTLSSGSTDSCAYTDDPARTAIELEAKPDIK
tara:strand:- start:1824 stop:1985 length:162 start_codon:yes stop_codon:yes gene_type:complete